MNEQLNNRAFLPEVCLIRIVLIVLLVAYHAFAPFVGVWVVPSGFESHVAYSWIGSACYSFMLEGFVFISGLIFGYEINRKGLPAVRNRALVSKKFRRLLLPSLFFSALYFVAFGDLSRPWSEIAYSLIDGVEHLWFLPMLFWCFMLMAALLYFNFRRRVVIGIAGLFAVAAAAIPLPLQMSNTLYYFIFFLTGTYLGMDRRLTGRKVSGRSVAVSGLLYIASFVIFENVARHLSVFIIRTDRFSGIGQRIIYLYDRCVDVMGPQLCSLVYSAFGVAFIYLLVRWALASGRWHVSERVVRISGYCFGVYIYQQFFYLLLYYKMGWLASVDSRLLPWLAMGITLAGSVLLTALTLRTRLGRYLIGG